MSLILALVFLVLSANPSYSADDSKRMLDEKVRYIQAPKGGDSFGVLREKRLRWKFDASEVYDDNIFLTHTDARYDLITSLNPGAYGYYGNSDNFYFASYEADVLLYARYNAQTCVNQVVNARMELNRNSRVKLTIKDQFQPTNDQSTSEQKPFVKRIYNDFDAILRYDISPKTSLEAVYKQVLQNYVSSQYQSYSHLEQMVAPVLYWHPTPKTSLTAEYDLGFFRYYEGGVYLDSVYSQVRGGIVGKLTSKSTILLKAGYQYRTYDDADRKDVQLGVLECAYDYRLSDKTTVEIVAARLIDESVYSDVGYYRSINLYVSIKHDFTSQLGLDISGSYLRSDYPRETNGDAEGEFVKRSDNLYGASAKLRYAIKHWISAYVAYNFALRNSNILIFDYKDSKISGGLKADF